MPKRATLLGVYLHGSGGDIEYSQRWQRPDCRDIAEALPRALLELQKPANAIDPARALP
jgi:NAD(P)H-hydrate repair Nnr-like enzyme with NAD(P)H-hydrate dehydratase domain